MSTSISVPSRAALTGVIAGFLALPAAAATCPAGFPNKPIRFVVGFGAGGGTDVIGRAVANGIEKQQKWTVVVENKPGAGGGVLNSWLKAQAPDGYAIGVNGTDSVTINPAQANVGYEWQDFDYLGSGMQTWYALVALADRPYRDLPGLIAYAREKGRATISVNGVIGEILVKQLAKEYGVNLVPVPGTGAAEAMTAALGGHVDATTQGTLHVAQIRSGKMRQLVSLINRRVPYAPDSATLAEQGSKTPPLESHTFFMTPNGLSPEIKTCLKQAIDEAVNAPEYKAQMAKFDNEALNLGEDGNIEINRRLAAFYKDALGQK
ncbi:tripartite tricarboxylate transporter substrate binding protein [Bosea caraganae]|uniref:Tripartite tricarboxylate transporter substrate binding protein n=1 Tax=Bosea caraganae TaxID=2763117 RepID=A0A370KZD1_9HYPH|nr:tripartite tricarboxylate transporter substrate binding protein [Bosea caraganae]RDJ20360.1 tripartite tricarboxylate transporter substrate binding protein [Bosea caraganae]RDJ26559.1 tripartite tricarboxylate transporter substrate binding protein [Bosea caraganae]